MNDEYSLQKKIAAAQYAAVAHYPETSTVQLDGEIFFCTECGFEGQLSEFGQVAYLNGLLGRRKRDKFPVCKQHLVRIMCPDQCDEGMTYLENDKNEDFSLRVCKTCEGEGSLIVEPNRFSNDDA